MIIKIDREFDIDRVILFNARILLCFRTLKMSKWFPIGLRITDKLLFLQMHWISIYFYRKGSNQYLLERGSGR